MKKLQHTLCYVSSARKSLSSTDINHLFTVNKRNNIDLDISGILIYNNGNFFQVLEGEKSKLDYLFSKISEDERHYNIIKLINSTADNRIFKEYNSGFILTNNSTEIKQLINYLNWLKEADLPKINRIVQLVEKFIARK
jgi:hypothetical protein